jgi:RNA exonuclease 4
LSSLLYGLTVSPLSPAKTFEEVQGAVAELMKDRILIGHAVQNDLKVRFALFLLAHGTQILAPQALMLSHPRAQLRDTQILAHRHGQSRSARPALRNLVHDMLGAKIQEGEHSSVRRNISPVSEAFTESDDR